MGWGRQPRAGTDGNGLSPRCSHHGEFLEVPPFGSKPALTVPRFLGRSLPRRLAEVRSLCLAFPPVGINTCPSSPRNYRRGNLHIKNDCDMTFSGEWDPFSRAATPRGPFLRAGDEPSAAVSPSPPKDGAAPQRSQQLRGRLPVPGRALALGRAPGHPRVPHPRGGQGVGRPPRPLPSPAARGR